MPERFLYNAGSIRVNETGHPDSEAAIRKQLSVGADLYLAVSDGETGRRSNWLVPFIQDQASNPDYVQIRKGDCKSYDDVPMYKKSLLRRIHPKNLPFNFIANARESWPVFDDLRHEFNVPNLPMQVGIFGPLDPVIFTEGEGRVIPALLHQRAYQTGLQMQINSIQRSPHVGGALRDNKQKDVIFNLEVPGEVAAPELSLDKVHPRLPHKQLSEMGKNVLSRFVASKIVNLASNAPEGTRFGVHFCFGDLENEAYIKPADMSPVVRLANFVIERWPQGRPLEYLHLPLALGDQPPSLERKFYMPLADLKLQGIPDTRISAGFIHEGATIDDQVWVQRQVDVRLTQAAERPIKAGVARSCGMGRISLEAVDLSLQRAAHFAQR